LSRKNFHYLKNSQKSDGLSDSHISTAPMNSNPPWQMQLLSCSAAGTIFGNRRPV